MGGNRNRNCEEALPERDELPIDAAQCRTLGEYIDLILRKTQIEIADAGTLWMRQNGRDGCMYQTQVSELRNGKMPRDWERYMAALDLGGNEHQFYRLVRNAKKWRLAREAQERALQAPANETEPLFRWIDGVDGIVLQLRADVANREAV